jgi:hypothetical protein
MNARKLGALCALLAATPNLSGRESSRSQDYQFEKQVKRAQECRELQDKLVGDQPLTPERAEEITKIMEPNVPIEPVDKSQTRDRLVATTASPRPGRGRAVDGGMWEPNSFLGS